jgi:hypothetical protein
MNNSTGVVDQPKTKRLPKEMTAENKHLFPEDMQKAFDFLEKNKNKILLPHKYISAQKTHLSGKLIKLSRSNSGLPPRQVLIQMLEPMPDIIPASMLAELTVFILEKWTQLTEKEPSKQD